MARSFGFGGRDELGIGEKLLRLNWLLAALLVMTACVGFVMLYSVAGGSLDPWARVQIVRFAAGFGMMLLVALVDLKLWRMTAIPLYAVALILLVLVELFGAIGMGAQRWLVLGPIRVQPSELMKIALVMALARYYHWLDPERVSRPLWVAVPLLIVAAPALLVVKQPDLGTALLLVAGAAVVMFLAGVSLWWFFAGTVTVLGSLYAVIVSRGTSWQILKEYQYRRIETFLDPSQDPLGAGYHITQSKIAIGSGGLEGRGFLQGWQTHQSFLPEPETDFIFATLAEELGFRGGFGLLVLYMVIIMVSMIAAARIQSTFGRLMAAGVAATFFFFFAINMAMVMGLAPVVGVPLPLVSFGGTSMLVILFGFGLMMSAQIHGSQDTER